VRVTAPLLAATTVTKKRQFKSTENGQQQNRSCASLRRDISCPNADSPVQVMPVTVFRRTLMESLILAQDERWRHA
jgi:hypothetical protein